MCSKILLIEIKYGKIFTEINYLKATEIPVMFFFRFSEMYKYKCSSEGQVFLHRVPVPGMETHIPVLFLDLSGMSSIIVVCALNSAKSSAVFSY